MSLSIPVVIVLLCALLYGFGASVAPAGPVPAWIEQEKIRGYWNAPVDLIAPLQEAGFSTLFQRLEISLDPQLRENAIVYEDRTFHDEEADTLKSSRLAKTLGLHCFHVLDPAPVELVPAAGFKHNPRRFHDGKLPCPLDKVFWDRVMTDRFMYIIDLLAGPEYQLDGLLIDPEMYHFNGAFITIPCYC